MNENLERNKVYKLLFQGRKFLINPPFQKKFMGFILASVILSMGIMHGANWVFFNKFMNYGETLNLPSNHPFYRLLMEQQEFMTLVFLISSTILSVALCTFGLFFSHRIAGPIYRIEKVFKDASISGEQIESIRFRHDDFFQEIPSAMNEYFKNQEKKEKLKEVS
ncbi:hypothetical protein BIY24_12085 [Halobacteriovorax marinus]|nr:hypothetical protein [Halobacteriovorax marinus]ATH08659.1 hypothetical protein BIY24_12085 [Halobacteriovorax marinus]